jgi:hypothetical protein
MIGALARTRSVALAVAVVLIVGGCGLVSVRTQPDQGVCNQQSPKAGTTGAPVNVPITVTGAVASLDGARAMVQIQVGHNQSLPVLLDTGSSGLYVLSSALPNKSGITESAKQAGTSYGSGTKLSGTCSSAQVSLAGATTASPINFVSVDEVQCAPRRLLCQQGGTFGPGTAGLVGILGIGLQPGHATNPLPFFPGEQGKAWSIALVGTAGVLKLGASVPARSQAKMNFPTLGRAPGGMPFWDDGAGKMCWTYSGGQPTCVDTLFDTGTPPIVWPRNSPLSLGAPTSFGGSPVSTGTAIAVAGLDEALPFWQFIAGSVRSQNLVEIAQTDQVLAGIGAYFNSTITYDRLDGELYVS